MDITSIVLQRKKTEGGKVSSFPFYSSFVPPTKVFCQRPFQLKKLLNSRVPKLQRSDHSKQFYLSLILLQKATFKAIYSLLKQVGEAHTKNLIRTPSSSSTSICFILQVAEFALAVVAMMYVPSTQLRSQLSLLFPLGFALEPLDFSYNSFPTPVGTI